MQNRTEHNISESFSRLWAILLIVGISALFFGFFSSLPVSDARHVVAEVDSLRMAGVSYDDSISIAEAATTLSHVRAIYRNDYAHANYYYGRLLRNRGDQPAAMLAFLRVVHSRTIDHEIAARSNSNIANMCRLANEHELAFEMYSKAADEFLLARDSLMYFYSLNNQAYDLAEDTIKDKAIALTNHIENNCTDTNVLTKIWETRADVYVHAQMYDSALFCLRRLHARGNQEPTGMLLLARVFENTGKNDSALFYAKRVFEESAYYGDRYNALYILTHNDSTLNGDEILSLTSEREDVRFKEYEPVKIKLTQAIQLLEQDLNRKPDYTWLWAILVSILVIGIPSCVYISRKRKKRQLISQQTEELLQKKEQLSEQLEQIQVKHNTLSEQTQRIEQQQTARSKRIIAEIELYCSPINPDNFRQELCWDNYDKMCVIVNKHMFKLVDKLKASGLTYDKAIQLCVLVVINKFSDKQMADILLYGEKSIRSIKRKVANSLGTSSKNLREHLLEMAVLG